MVVKIVCHEAAVKILDEKNKVLRQFNTFTEAVEAALKSNTSFVIPRKADSDALLRELLADKIMLGATSEFYAFANALRAHKSSVGADIRQAKRDLFVSIGLVFLALLVGVVSWTSFVFVALGFIRALTAAVGWSNAVNKRDKLEQSWLPIWNDVTTLKEGVDAFLVSSKGWLINFDDKINRFNEAWGELQTLR